MNRDSWPPSVERLWPPSPKPRLGFNPLALTQGEFEKLGPEDQRAYDIWLLARWSHNAEVADGLAAARDYEDHGHDGTDLTPNAGA